MKNRALLIVLPVALVLGLLVAVLAGSDPAVNRKTKSPLLGQPAPDIRGTLVKTGSQYSLAFRPGRWTVVNFFASWCRECVDEHPELIKFSQSHTPTEVELVSVLFDDKTADAAKFFNDRGGDWPVVIDDGTVSTDYGVSAVPETFLIAPNGIVVVKFVGRVSAVGLDQVMAQITQEAAAASSKTSAP